MAPAPLIESGCRRLVSHINTVGTGEQDRIQVYSKYTLSGCSCQQYPLSSRSGGALLSLHAEPSAQPGFSDLTIALCTQGFEMQLIPEPGLPPLPLIDFQACSPFLGKAGALVFARGTVDG